MPQSQGDTRSSPLLGCIADDFTGATDLANMLVKNGMRTVQLLGVPGPETEVPAADAVVVALKSRTNPVDEAISMSLAALEWLRKAGVRQFFFKYCSTFDSTEKGNIGPVAEALLDTLDADFTIACPALPENARSVYQGHLFVGDTLLSESSMRNHPLNPMTDSNLVRFLGCQTQGKVGLVPFAVVDAGPQAVSEAFAAARADGMRFAIVDAVSERDLATICTACADLPLITGGSGVALGLPENFRQAGLLEPREHADALPKIPGAEAVISGSCSPATLAQVETMRKACPTFDINPLALADGKQTVAQVIDWAVSRIGNERVLITASAPPDKVAAVQERLGVAAAGELVEKAFSKIARALVDAGVRRMVVAGGETSGAVVGALGIRGLRIGREIAPGVPCTASIGKRPMALALKSGNFGGPNFFAEALDMMP